MNTENTPPNEQEFYQKLKEQLQETTVFPSEYLYKFILPNTPESAERLYAVFQDVQAQFVEKPSKNGKYMSYSIKVMATNADQVIALYKEAGKIENIISL